jgi:curli biogenesis system outer membrane secretion channel CsgG
MKTVIQINVPCKTTTLKPASSKEKIGGIMLLAIVAICVSLLATGCTTQKTWVYHANSYPPAVASTGKKIAVLAFEDGRPNVNQNMWGMYALPLMPFGWQTLDTPEGISRHATTGMWLNFKPTEDFPKAVAEDLRNTGLFSDAFFSYAREGSDYAVEGKILSTAYSGRIISYGLGFYGPDLWIIGFPATWTENDLSLELRLVNSATDETLFSKTYTANPRTNLSWIYYINNDFNYSEMMAEVNKQFCQDIEPIILKAAQQSTKTAEATKSP